VSIVVTLSVIGRGIVVAWYDTRLQTKEDCVWQKTVEASSL